MGVDVQQTTSQASEMEGGEITVAAQEADDGVLLFPAHLCDSLRELEFMYCKELVLVDAPFLQALRFLEKLSIRSSPMFLSAFSFSRHIFPSSLQFLELWCVEGMGTLEPLSNLSSLTKLVLWSCGEDLKCQGLRSLLTTGGQLNELEVTGSPRFFAGWNPNPRRALEDVEGEEEHHTQLVSCTLQKLCTDDTAGLLSAPICSLLSSSLTKLVLEFSPPFSKEHEDALQLLSSLQELKFDSSYTLRRLPEGLRNLTNLKILSIEECSVSLPNDGLPKSLQEIDVIRCHNEELQQQCRGLVGIIPRVNIRG